MPFKIGSTTIEKIVIDGKEIETVIVDGVTVFEAIPTYTITVTANGVTTQHLIKEGELASTVVKAPSRSGWMFYGWFEFARDDMDFNPNTTRVYKNYMISAKWMKRTETGTCRTCYCSGQETSSSLCYTCYGDGGYYDTCDNCDGYGEGYGWVSCESCYGLGYYDWEFCGSCNGDMCSDCNWTGFALCTTCEGAGGYDGYGTCNDCSGEGEKWYYCYDCEDGYIYETSTCSSCLGSGKAYTTTYEYY